RKPGSQEKNNLSEMHYSPLLGSWIPYRKPMKVYEFNFVHLLTPPRPNSRRGGRIVFIPHCKKERNLGQNRRIDERRG
ncbi:MAG: hypothetical protein KAJ05_07730, partial [Candidatus Latescibacteria bacterium]|nr:hypothetical protein [Candidatus Latescibacterota bacterium]